MQKMAIEAYNRAIDLADCYDVDLLVDALRRRGDDVGQVYYRGNDVVVELPDVEVCGDYVAIAYRLREELGLED